MIYRIAQVNVARLRAPLDSVELTDFVAALAPVNASADQAPGFLWRLQTEDGNSTSIRAFEWDVAGSAGVIVNLSVWETIEQLSEWVHGRCTGQCCYNAENGSSESRKPPLRCGGFPTDIFPRHPKRNLAC